MGDSVISTIDVRRVASRALVLTASVLGIVGCERSAMPTAASTVPGAISSAASGMLIGRFDARLPGTASEFPSAVPGAPGGLTASVSGNAVSLTWNAAPGDLASYVIEAGSASGLSDLANFVTGNLLTSFSATSVPNGTYFVRVRAANASGAGAASNEVTVVIGSCTTPAAPAGLTSSVSGTTVSLGWSASAGASSYQLEAGSASGIADLFNGDVGANTTVVTPAPPGTYFVRVRAKSACGISPPSNEVTVVVETVCTPIPIVPTTLTFSGVSIHGGALSSYSESGFTLSLPSGNWRGSTQFGNPAPFVQFVRPAGPAALTEVITLTTGGLPFHFGSFEVYSSVVPVPYTFTGRLNSQPVFSRSNTLPNPMGRFVPISNPDAIVPIDELIISLTNTASTCCSNPVGIDNLLVARRCAETTATFVGGLWSRHD
jgi:hypothetical protein